jgi:hypothetical protein
MALISGFFGSEWPTQALAAAYEEVRDEDHEILFAAHRRITLEFTPKLQPPLTKIVAVIKDEGRKRRQQYGTKIEEDWNRTKHQPSRFGDSSSKHSTDAMRLINGVLDGKLSNDQLVEGMMAMNQTYPGVGWDTEALSFIRYLDGKESSKEPERNRYAD